MFEAFVALVLTMNPESPWLDENTSEVVRTMPAAQRV